MLESHHSFNFHFTWEFETLKQIIIEYLFLIFINQW